MSQDLKEGQERVRPGMRSESFSIRLHGAILDTNIPRMTFFPDPYTRSKDACPLYTLSSSLPVFTIGVVQARHPQDAQSGFRIHYISVSLCYLGQVTASLTFSFRGFPPLLPNVTSPQNWTTQKPSIVGHLDLGSTHSFNLLPPALFHPSLHKAQVKCI